MDYIEVYHGGYCQVEFPEIIIGKYAKDFGGGFYCTELKEQAARWARRYDNPVISIFRFEIDYGLKILHFTEMTEEWLDFIVNCRNGVKHNYDIVIGYKRAILGFGEI